MDSKYITYKEEDGYCTYTISKDSIYIERIRSYKKGFGSKMMKTIVKESIDNGLHGNVRTQACWSSHIFWIYMGMIPIDMNVHYVSSKYGIIGLEAINQYPLIKSSILESKPLNSFTYLPILKKIINMEYDLNIDGIDEHTLLKMSDKLITLSNKEASYIETKFVPRLISVLQSKRLDTNYFGSVNMTLSKEGLNRWKECIKDNKPFIPFRDLSHMRQYMNSNQVEIMSVLN